MRNPAALLVCGTLVVPALWCQTPPTPNLEGYVTRVASSSDFDVDGIRVQCGPETQTNLHLSSTDGLENSGCPEHPLYVGEQVQVYGSLKKKRATILASRIDIPSPVSPHSVEGSAVIDAVLPPESAHSAVSLLVRADGYRILIDGETKVKLAPPLKTLADVKAGSWMDYEASAKSSDVLTAAWADLASGDPSAQEERFRAKQGYDPTKFPPFVNPALQARIDAIGNKLVPAYQRTLPDTDPARIHFRFQLIDTDRLREALTLPNGITLVPHQVVERLKGDSELATVLADSIATALERQQYRMRQAVWASAAGLYGGWLLFPVTGVTIPAASVLGAQEMENRLLEQSGRESLALLNDAGYDIDQAPMAWWLLASNKPLAKTPMPQRAAYLYSILGAEWHNPADVHAPAGADRASAQP
jgi:hypothetical protein